MDFGGMERRSVSRSPNVVWGLVVLLTMTGCLAGWGSEPEEPRVVVRTYEPINVTHEPFRYGHQQQDSEITTPVPLKNKTPRDDVNVTLVEERVTEKLEKHRDSNDVGSLVSDPRLARIARHHSYDMATRDYIGHDDPDGVSFSDRLAKGNYACVTSRENVAAVVWKTNDTQTEEELAEAVIRGFIRSQGHNMAMIDPDMTTVGIGAYVAEDGVAYITMNLCEGGVFEDTDK